METSPFPHQGPLQPEQVVGRQELTADLVARITERRVTALLGPRRYGKTSVLRLVSAQLTEVQTIWVDLYEVASMIDLAIRFDEALTEAPASLGPTLREISGTMALDLGVARLQMSRAPKDRPDAHTRFSSLVRTIVQSARHHPILLVLDEFSGIGRVEGAAGLLRTALQHHYREIGLVFAGSAPSVMRQLFTGRTEPFYGQADLVTIAPLSRQAVVALVISGFAQTGRDGSQVAPLIHEFARGHPQRTMQVADACWRRTALGSESTPLIWSRGLDDVRQSTDDAMERLFSHHEQRERDVLRVVASGGSLFGRAADLLGLPSGSARHARQVLLDEGDLVRVDDEVLITDPIMADWIRRTLPL